MAESQLVIMKTFLVALSFCENNRILEEDYTSISLCENFSLYSSLSSQRSFFLKNSFSNFEELLRTFSISLIELFYASSDWSCKSNNIQPHQNLPLFKMDAHRRTGKKWVFIRL